MKKDDYKRTSFGGSKFFMNDLDKELQAAEKFLNKNNDEILKINSSSLNDNMTEFSLKSSIENNPEKNKKLDPSLFKYKKQLKAFGFPEIGDFYFTSDSQEDKQKTFSFFDYVIMKKSAENEDKMKFKKQVDILTFKISTLQTEKEKLEKELLSINEEMKKISKDKKDFEVKINKSKEVLDKQVAELKMSNQKLTNKFNTMMIEKKSYEEKFNKLAESYQKIINKSGNMRPMNQIDMIEGLKRNDLVRILSKVKGTEKLIETIKNGFNESLRELLFEISALKNFIYEINSDITNCVKINNSAAKMSEIEYGLLNMPFLDTVNKFKYIFKNNLKTLTQFISNNNCLFSIDPNEAVENKNEFDMTFDKSGMNKPESSLVFEIEDNIKSIISDSNSNFFKKETEHESNYDNDEDYEKELEFLKNKWVKTLMNIKNKTDDD